MHNVASIPHAVFHGLLIEINYSPETLALNESGKDKILDGYLEVVLYFHKKAVFACFIVRKAHDREVDFISDSHFIAALLPTDRWSVFAL